MYACICHAVPDTAVIDILAAGGTRNAVTLATRAGTSCGRCGPTLAALASQAKRCERTGGLCAGCRHASAP